MDELTIADKKYLSSKKAAKLTGYAKDYVGQLCREGKVEARLVGRNWYVLEDSILEHRFGASEHKEEKEEDISMPASTPESMQTEEKDVLQYSWNSPVYTAESYSSLPLPIEPTLEASTPIPNNPVEQQSNPRALNDMQTAWQEWFSKQKEAEKMLPDASEMLLSAPEDSGPSEEPYFFEEHTTIREEEPVTIQKEQIYATSSEETPISIKREVTELREEYALQTNEPGPRITRIVPKREVSSSRSEYKALKAPKNALTVPKQGKGVFLLKVTLLSVAGMFIAITYLAFSMKETAESGNGNVLTNFLTGVHTIEIAK